MSIPMDVHLFDEIQSFCKTHNLIRSSLIRDILQNFLKSYTAGGTKPSRNQEMAGEVEEVPEAKAQGDSGVY